MKIITTVLLIVSSISYAKSQGGIYMSLADYEHNKLSYEASNSKSCKIHLHDFFWNMSTVTVTENGKKYTLKKDALYGYKDCKNEVYRFYDNMEYRIAEAGHIYIYVQKESTAQNKNNEVINKYYFSTKPDGEILPLTISNLKKAYKDNDSFCDLIDKFFSENNVCAYDEVHSTFKVNYIFSK